LSVKDKMTVGLKRAQKSLDAFGKRAKTGAAVGGAAVFAGVTAAVKSAIDAGGELNDMMTRTGASGEGLFVMQKAFENAGIAASQVPAALNKMQKSLVGGNDGFDKLGLSIAGLMDMDATDAFRSIAENIADVEDPSQRAAIAMEIFGKSGASLLALMNDGGAFSQAEEQVGSLGKTLAENAGRLDAVGDSLGQINT
jgi:hypothetical protein